MATTMASTPASTPASTLTDTPKGVELSDTSKLQDIPLRFIDLSRNDRYDIIILSYCKLCWNQEYHESDIHQKYYEFEVRYDEEFFYFGWIQKGEGYPSEKICWKISVIHTNDEIAQAIFWGKTQ